MDKPKINWRLLYDKGPVALFMAPSAFPIGVWFYESVLPTQLRSQIPGLDIAAGVVAVLAGFAIDIGIVRIATGKPTHELRRYSWTTWVPIIVWLMGCAILYDWYSQGTWAWSPSTLTHLAFPTISLVMALYWSFEHGYEDTIRKPILDQLAGVQLLVKWLKVEINRVGQELIAEKELATTTINQIKADLTAEVVRLTEQLASAKADQLFLVGEVDRFTAELTAKDEAHQREIDRLRMNHANEIQDLVNEAIEIKRRLKQELDWRAATEAKINAQPDMSKGQKAAIRELMRGDEAITSDEIIRRLNIDPDDKNAVQSARTQISQVKRELGATTPTA